MRSETQSNEIDDLDEQSFPEVNVQRISQPYHRNRQDTFGQLGDEEKTTSVLQRQALASRSQHLRRNDDNFFGDDDFANESANVSEAHPTEAAGRAVNQAIISDITQGKKLTHLYSPQNHLGATSPTRSRHQKQGSSMDEHGQSPGRPQAYQPYQIKKPQNLQDKKSAAKKDSRNTWPARQTSKRTRHEELESRSHGQNQQVSGRIAQESARRNQLKLFP